MTTTVTPVLVRTGIEELHPLTTDPDPPVRPTQEWDLDLAGSVSQAGRLTGAHVVGRRDAV